MMMLRVCLGKLRKGSVGDFCVVSCCYAKTYGIKDNISKVSYGCVPHLGITLVGVFNSSWTRKRLRTLRNN